MSGGRFDYVQYRFTQIADDIERAIENNNVPNDEWSSGANDFSDETLAEFRTAIDLLKRAQVYVHRVDWLLSHDDSEGCFHGRLIADLEKLNK